MGMELVIGAAGSTAAAARRAARAGRLGAAAQWARWTLTLEDAPPEGTFARALAWRLLTRGSLVPVAPDVEAELRGRFGARTGAACAAFHRLQCAALLVESSGLPSRLETDLARLGEFSTDEASGLCELARTDLGRLLNDLGRLYPQTNGSIEGPLSVSWTGGMRPGRRTAWVADGGERTGCSALRADGISYQHDEDALASLARRIFRVETLRAGQADGVAALLSGRDLSLHLPTGGGKSLVYQLAALLMPGTALVVAPLRALLRDQARRLNELGITRHGLLVGDDPERTQAALAELSEGRLLLALAAPERLDAGAFRRALRGAAETEGISFAAVDEAQCAARRGPDWRPSYRALGARLRDWASTDGHAPPLAALSGAASAGALAEAERVLRLADPVRAGGGAARGGLSFRVWTSAAPDHLPRLRDLLTRIIPDGRFGPGIVFCPRVEGPLGAADIAEELVWSEGIDAASYTGRAPAGAVDFESTKRRAAEEFLTGRRGLLCATRAFGLGVDRADVRFTVHVGLPSSLEEFFQQAGRAGRDGGGAQCWVLLQAASARRARRWAGLPLERLRAEVGALAPHERDDVSRAYAFHLAAFPGEAAERRDAELALAACGDPARAGDAFAELPGQDPAALTRALLRLEEARVVSLEERAARGWRLRLSGGWSVKTARAAAAEKVARDYRAVEPARRRSLEELVELALSPDAGAALARRLSA